MEPVGGLNKSVTEVNGKHDVSKPPNECLTHVIDGHVIQESSQPFPLDDDSKGTYNYMVIAMYTFLLSTFSLLHKKFEHNLSQHG